MPPAWGQSHVRTPLSGGARPWTPISAPPIGKGRRNAASPCADFSFANGVPRRQPIGIAENRGATVDPLRCHVAEISGSLYLVAYYCAVVTRDGSAKPWITVPRRAGTAIADGIGSRSRDIHRPTADDQAGRGQRPPLQRMADRDGDIPDGRPRTRGLDDGTPHDDPPASGIAWPTLSPIS